MLRRNDSAPGDQEDINFLDAFQGSARFQSTEVVVPAEAPARTNALVGDMPSIIAHSDACLVHKKRQQEPHLAHEETPGDIERAHKESEWRFSVESDGDSSDAPMVDAEHESESQDLATDSHDESIVPSFATFMIEVNARRRNAGAMDLDSEAIISLERSVFARTSQGIFSSSFQINQAAETLESNLRKKY